MYVLLSPFPRGVYVLSSPSPKRVYVLLSSLCRGGVRLIDLPFVGAYVRLGSNFRGARLIGFAFREGVRPIGFVLS